MKTLVNCISLFFEELQRTEIISLYSQIQNDIQFISIFKNLFGSS